MHRSAWECTGVHGSAWECLGVHGSARESTGVHAGQQRALRARRFVPPRVMWGALCSLGLPLLMRLTLVRLTFIMLEVSQILGHFNLIVTRLIHVPQAGAKLVPLEVQTRQHTARPNTLHTSYTCTYTLTCRSSHYIHVSFDSSFAYKIDTLNRNKCVYSATGDT